LGKPDGVILYISNANANTLKSSGISGKKVDGTIAILVKDSGELWNKLVEQPTI